MKKYFFPLGLIVFFALLGAAEAAPEVKQDVVALLKPKLNSDRIEYFFGKYGVDALDIDSPVFPGSRIANLHSVHQDDKIMRTLAIVDFFQPTHEALISAHTEIQNGKSIGITLRDQGWDIHKNPVYFGEIALSPALMDWMDEHSVDRAAVHIYRLEVSKGAQSDSIPYCTIIEVHSPQYLSGKWLQSLYDDQYSDYSIASEESLAVLSRLSTLISEFPNNQ